MGDNRENVLAKTDTRQLLEELLARFNGHQAAAGLPPRGSKLLYTKDEVAERIGVCRRTVEHLIRSGALRAVHLGRKCFVRPDELDRLIKSGNRTIARARFNQVA